MDVGILIITKKIQMCVAELGAKLSDMYNNAPKEKAIGMIRLFGIRYAAEINQGNYSKEEILKASGICETYLNELSIGVKLSEYVHSRHL